MARRLSSKNIRSTARTYRSRRKILVSILFTLFFICLGYSVYGNLFHITSVTVSGHKHTDPELVKQIATEAQQGTRWLVFPRSNRFFFPNRSFTKQLFETVPSILTIDIDVDGHEMRVHISDRKAAGLWCDEAKDCSVFDENGIVFRKSFLVSGLIFVKWTHPGTQVNIGEKVPCIPNCINPEYIQFLLDHKIETILMQKDGQLLQSLHGYTIKAGSDAGLTIKRMGLLEAKKIQINDLQYVDVRFPNKIYYK